ncbi:MAG: hypothetical protein UR99_C0026G0013 [Candidatus Moranbacteria bacterium GW2011_GWD2_36_12]|nr:MAG: hypothetical protein UR99_C0026G0013 [Candidatus Moranbacteria bacterium GW2011_GWD2_36_12]KKQ06523.1 MAG: hypothetical protein US16_C0015G0020 [Candidatus Moranbacteria bacterium GW2011_GWE2_36_40]
MCISSGGCFGVYEDEEFRSVVRSSVDEEDEPGFFTELFSLFDYQ